MYKVVIKADEQIPFQDVKVNKAVNDFCEDFQPDLILHNGDFMDFPDLTTKFTRNHANVGNLVKELDMGRLMLEEERRICPNAEIVLLPGNHEERLNRLVEERADALTPLLGSHLSLKSLLDPTNSIGLEVIGNYAEGTAYWTRGGLLVTHGKLHGVSAARKMWEKYGSCIFSHIHRETVHNFTNYDGTHTARSTGCLCNIKGKKMPPGYGDGNFRDHAQGFAVVIFDDRNRYTVYPVSIVNGEFRWVDGTIYK